MKKIVINATLLDEKITGIGQYQLNVIRALSKIEGLYLKVIVTKAFIQSEVGLRFLNDILEEKEAEIEFVSVPSLKIIYRLKSLLGFYLKKDFIYHDLAFNSALGKNTLAKIVTFHDAFFLDKNLWQSSRGFPAFNAKYILPWSAKNADHIVVQTNVVKKKLIEALQINPNKISVIPMGNPFIDFLRENKISREITGNDISINGKVIKKPYILTVGAGHPRKRTKDLIKASSRVHIPHTLVITGKNAIDEPGVREALNDNKNVIILDYVKREDLVKLYYNASALFFPSADEGFGFPIIEALTLKLPVVASDIEVFKEVGGNFIDYFPIGDIDKIAHYIELALKDKIFIRDKKAIENWLSRFTWENYANELLKIYSMYA